MNAKWIFCLLATLFVVEPLIAETTPPNWGNTPLVFEPNVGQTSDAVRYISRANGYTLFLTDNEAVLSFARPASGTPTVVRMKLAGANAKPVTEALEPQSGASHYFLDGDKSGWQGTAPQFAKILYRSVYAGVDLTYYGNQRQLEYDFLVAPRQNPSTIQFEISGADALSIAENGDLILETSAGPIRQQRPVAYQEVGGIRTSVEAAFTISGERHVGFRVGRYDRNLPLIIDPTIVYSTYVGGAATSVVGDVANSIAVDAAGIAYVTGLTGSLDFPTVGPIQPPSGGTQDAFVLKLNADGSAILASTYFGGSGNDEGHGIALDGAGNIYVTGYTSSPNFPIVNGFQRSRGGGQDGYLLKLDNAASTILYSTYLGGNRDDRAVGLAVDSAGNAYLTGFATSRNFPVRSAAQPIMGNGLGDAFVTKISASGDLAYSTYLGGFGDDLGYGIAIDSDGSAYVVGATTSTNFPLKNPILSRFNGLQDGFIAKISPEGNTLVFSTYWGGSGDDIALRTVVDSDHNIYVTGLTSSQDFPIADPLQPFNLGQYDIFLTKFGPDFTGVTFSTYLGADGSESGVGMALDSENNIYLAGFTGSFSFPVINSFARLNALNGGDPNLDRDGYLIKVAADGHSLILSTYYGNVGNDGVLSLALGQAGDVYLAGYTASVSFPVAHPLQAQNAGGVDGFIAKINVSDVIASMEIAIPNGGGVALNADTIGRTASVGYVNVVRPDGVPGLAGLTMLTVRQANGSTTEVALPLSAPIQHGRFFVELADNVLTSLAMVNPSDEDIEVTYFHTDFNGNSSTPLSLTIPPRGQASGFVANQAPYFLPLAAPGTLTFDASAPIVAVAIRNFTSDTDAQFTRLPIFDPTVADNQTTVLSGVADGGGWQTHMILINTSDDVMSGELRFFGPENSATPGPMEFTFFSASGSVIPYTIPARSAQRFDSTSAGPDLVGGFALVAPDAGMNRPGAFALLTQGKAIASLESRLPGSTFRLYAERSGNFAQNEPLATTTHVTLSNPFASPTAVQMELIGLDGVPTGLSHTVAVAANGQSSGTLDAFGTLGTAPNPFRGLLKITVLSGPGIVPVGMLRRLSVTAEMTETTTGPISDDMTTGPFVLPQLAAGSDFTSTIILLSSSTGLGSTAVSELRNQTGRPMYLTIRDLASQPIRVPDVIRSIANYSINSGGAAAFTIDGAGSEAVGYASIEPGFGESSPVGMAVISQLKGIRVISEHAVPLEPMIKNGRFYAEFGPDIATSLSLQNRSDQEIIITFFFTDAAGNKHFESQSTIPAKTEVSALLNQRPFNIAATSSGTFTFNTSEPVAAVAVRGSFDESTAFERFSRIPISNLDIVEVRPVVVSAFADSGGWTTFTALVNNTDDPMSGEIRLYGPGNTATPGPITATLNGVTASVFPYAIPARSAREFRSPGNVPQLIGGFMVIVPASGSNTPSAFLTAESGRILTSLEALPATGNFRLYVETAGNFDVRQPNSITTAMALANPFDTPTTVRLELNALDGTATGISVDVVVPAQGQLAAKLNEFVGFSSLPNSFKGVLRGTVISGQGIVPLGMRWRINSTSELLATTTGPIREDTSSTTTLVIPHVAVGEGFATDVILLGNSAGQGSSGVLRLLNEQSNPMFAYIR